jgi:hypothetical protein
MPVVRHPQRHFDVSVLGVGRDRSRRRQVVWWKTFEDDRHEASPLGCLRCGREHRERVGLKFRLSRWATFEADPVQLID